jgi:hypothetical protein
MAVPGILIVASGHYAPAVQSACIAAPSINHLEHITMSQKWANNGAGPIQCKRFNDVWGKLNWENKTFVELWGVIGKDVHSSTMTNLFGTTVRMSKR